MWAALALKLISSKMDRPLDERPSWNICRHVGIIARLCKHLFPPMRADNEQGKDDHKDDSVRRGDGKGKHIPAN